MNKKLKTLVVGGATLAIAAGGVFVPVSYAASDTADTVINATIGSVISISTSGSVNLNITPTASGSASSASDVVSVSTNNQNGYMLQLADADATNKLNTGSSNIDATSGTFSSPVAMDLNSWGYRVDGVGTFGAGTTTGQTNASLLTGSWAGVPVSGSPDTLKTTATTASSDTTTVWYGAFVDSTVANGTYSDTVTYTASTN